MRGRRSTVPIPERIFSLHGFLTGRAAAGRFQAHHVGVGLPSLWHHGRIEIAESGLAGKSNLLVSESASLPLPQMRRPLLRAQARSLKAAAPNGGVRRTVA